MPETGSLFGDGKDAGALRTIGEVASALGIRQHVLRYWEQHFPMLRPLKRSGGRRYYRPADVDLIATIDRLLNQEGYTIKGAVHALRTQPDAGRPEGGEAGGGPVTPARADATMPVSSAELLARLLAMRERLAKALEV